MGKPQVRLGVFALQVSACPAVHFILDKLTSTAAVLAFASVSNTLSQQQATLSAE
jgi:hypothetical protein